MKGCLPKLFLTCKCAKRKKRGWLGSISLPGATVDFFFFVFFRDGLETNRPQVVRMPSNHALVTANVSSRRSRQPDENSKLSDTR